VKGISAGQVRGKDLKDTAILEGKGEKESHCIDEVVEGETAPSRKAGGGICCLSRGKKESKALAT